ncbi:MAG: M24 family metallopeptidase [Candidatus Hodarchaeales archaeon]|jgi:methionyl aminopeptidase
MSWTANELHDLQLAGRIAKLTLDQVEKIIKPGMGIGILFDLIETTILKRADLAFPPNISLDTCAAHDTAAVQEKRKIQKKSLVKVDIGANVNGMLSDTSRTFSMDGKHGRLIKASKLALDEAVKIIKPGLRVNEIGEIVQTTIESFGCKPISNLTGHQLEKGYLHAGLSIPSVKSMPFSKRAKLKTGMILAIEPFATNGRGVNSGLVEDAPRPPLIFSVRGKPKSKIGEILVDKFHQVPFALRSAARHLSEKGLEGNNLGDILSKDNFHGYRPLVEKTGGMVSQAEHTVLVTTKGSRILT